MSKHKKLYIILLITLYIINNNAKRVEISCPDNCKCETYQNLRKANCEHAKLSDLRDSAPRKTEWLDFSYNYVSKLEENEFINNDLTSLKLLNLSHNKINEIHIHAFSKMANLRSLDLSFNAIQTISKEWFWELNKLEELYINNNNLDLGRNPIFESNTIKILNLAWCKIEHIQSDAFLKMPNLEQLDLIGNFFIDINTNLISNLQNLNIININNNDIRCTENGMDFLEYCKENQISLDFNFCKEVEELEESQEKFQKMVVAPNYQNSWIFENNDEIDEIKETSTCPPVEEIRENDILIRIFKLQPVIAAVLLITTGFFIGIIVGCTCQIGGGNLKPVEKTKKPVRRNYSVIRYPVLDRQSLMLDVEATAESTPMPERRLPTP